jgi:hypothetical protein
MKILSNFGNENIATYNIKKSKIENYSDPHTNINFLVQKKNPQLPISHVAFI